MSSERWRPTATQHLLLQAVHGQLSNAQEAWIIWNQKVDFLQEDIDPGSFSLLPLVADRLKDRLDHLPHGGRLKGILRRAWVESQINEQTLLRAAKICQDAEFNVLFVQRDGSAPGPKFQQQPTLLIPPEEAKSAVHILQQNSWRLNGVKELNLRRNSGILLTAPSSQSHCYIQWRPIIPLTDPASNAGLWQQIKKQSVEHHRALPPSIRLIKICLDGFIWRPIPNLLWSVEAAALLSSAAIDWEMVADAARFFDLVYPLNEMLTELRQAWGQPIPQEILNTFAQSRSLESKRALWVRLSRPANIRPTRLAWRWRQHGLYRAQREKSSFWGDILIFPFVLQQYHSL